MINVTSQYAAQTFLSPASTQIISQINGINASAVRSLGFARTYTRPAFAVTAPDGSLAKMFQIDCMINPNAEYAYQVASFGQQMVREAAAAQGYEYYIEVSPIPAGYYSILTWASNI